MKTALKHSLVIGMVAATFITACKKKDTTEPATVATTTTTSNEYFKCKIDGVSWAASKPLGNDTANSFSSNGKAYMMTNGTSDLTNQFALSIFPLAGGWALESSTFITNAFDGYEASFSLNGFQLSVTNDSINRIISGTYALPMINVIDNMDTIKITNGEFRVKY